jgi:hypothetical protein
MNRDRTRVMEKQGDQQFKLGEGELGLNQDIFTATQERYKKYGEKGDQINLGMQAARSGAELGDYGFEPNDLVTGISSTIAKPRTPAAITAAPTETAKPQAPADEYETEMSDFPEWLAPKAYTDYGDGLAVQTAGIANEIAKVPLRAVYHTRKALDPIAEALGGPTLPKIYPRRVKKSLAKKSQ